MFKAILLAAKLSITCFLQLDFSLVLLFNTHRIPFKKSFVSNALARYPEICLTVVHQISIKMLQLDMNMH